ncbi:HAMP domain-containing sensor histidine kinase [Devosia sp.]|uniref:HAMP domain-containing sensor histidine kinase n=1 Tax=Devosia sp. TaxID=1871048 RepID=UPI0032635D4B
MTPIALRLRLLAVSAVSITLALIVAGLGISSLFASHIETDVQSGLQDEMNRLIALLDVNTDPVSLSQPMPDPRFLKPYGGLYWQINDPATGPIQWSRSVWDTPITLTVPMPPAGQLIETNLVDPEGAQALGLVRKLLFERADGTTRTLDLIVAEDRSELDAAIAAFRFDLLRALAILAIALIAASWLQVTVGLYPLAAIRRGINAIRAGTVRRLDGSFPSEVVPLVNEVNELLDTQETSISFARARAADLAHGLKTALTVLSTQTDALHRSGQHEVARSIEDINQSMAATIDHQLALARLRHRSRSIRYSAPVLPSVERVMSAVRRTPQGALHRWTVAIDRSINIDLDPADLVELLGAVLENAANWANGAVSISATRSDLTVTITVDDDGPGVADDALTTLGQRGKRLDETHGGSGLGLAIVAEIAALNSGSVVFKRSNLGGLRVCLQLPAAA